MQILQEFITSIDLSDLQVDPDPHILLASPIRQSENVYSSSRHRIRVAVNLVVVSLWLSACAFGSCLSVCVFVILRSVFHLWCWLSSSNSCSCDLERAVKQTQEKKNGWEKSVVKNEKEVQKCTEIKRKDSSVSVHVTSTTVNCG